jgi:hypothetical protein
MKFSLASLTTLTNPNNYSESRIIFLYFCFGFPLISLVDFFQYTFRPGFRNNFQDYRRDSKQLLETHAALILKILFRFLGSSKKYSSCDTIPLNGL